MPGQPPHVAREPYRRVLVATDLSESDADAARAAASFAASDARYEVVHVVVPLPVAPAYMRPSDRRLLDDAHASADKDVLERLRHHAAGMGLPRHEARLLEGSAARQLAHEAERIQADLIVAGARGRGTMARVLLGSKARALLRQARCDVLIGRGKARADGPIVVATDFSPTSRLAGERARLLATHTGAPLVLVHADDPAELRSRLHLDEDITENDEHAWRGMAWYEEAVAEMARRYNAEILGAAAVEILRRGDPVEEIVQTAEEHGARLLVVGARGVSALGTLFFGSVAESLVERAGCPVLVVRH